MLILRSRQDYRDYLEGLQKMLETQRNMVPISELECMEFGLKLALNALAEWERQQPDKENPYSAENSGLERDQ